MADKISIQARSQNMQRIRSKNTKPETRVRQLLFGLGYRYRLHVRSLPGCPDIVFANRKKAIFVHGCFWHQHSDCRDAHLPKSRLLYWIPKLKRNVERDVAHRESLKDLKWLVLTVWACEIADEQRLLAKLQKFLA